jgi:hypothetical protein
MDAGYSPERRDDMTENAGASRVTLADLVTGGVVRAGTRVSASHKGHTYDATVTKDGKIRLPEGYEGSPSSAATQCTGTSVNGWKFWRIKGMPIDDFRSPRAG